MSARHRQALGRHGEALAAAHLEAAGCEILGRNVRAGGGEIDLVARDGDCLVFVEVKTRRPGVHGDPGEAVTPAKARALARAAQAWLVRHGGPDQACRCDVVAVEEDASRTEGRVEWWRDALPLGDFL